MSRWQRTSSRHVIPLAVIARFALARLPSRFRGELVFCTESGTAIDPENFTKRDCARALRRSGLRRIRFHDLRHTYASLLIDRYGHLMPDVHEAEAHKLDQLVFGTRAAPSATGAVAGGRETAGADQETDRDGAS